MSLLRRWFRVPARLRPLIAWRWFPHVALFALALALRLAWVVWVDREGFVLNDPLTYHASAASISKGEGFRLLHGEPTAQWPPGYSAVLGALYWVFGIDPFVGEVFNALLGAATVVLLVLLVDRVVDRRTAVVAGTILAVMPGPIMWTDVTTTETLYTGMFVLVFLLLAHARPTWPWSVAIGVAIGLGALVRGEALTWGLLPIVLFWRTVPRGVLVRRIGLAAAVAIACITPWTIRNAIVMDAFVPVASNASITLWSGHHAGATGGQTYPTSEYLAQFDPEPTARELQSARALRNDAIEYMVTHPVRELELIPLKLIHLNRGDSYALDWVNAAPDVAPISPIDAERIGVLADAAYYALLAVTLLGALLLGRGFWARPVGRCIAASFLTALFLYGFLYYGNYRYRLPYEPLMIVVAATFLTRAWDRRPFLADPS